MFAAFGLPGETMVTAPLFLVGVGLFVIDFVYVLTRLILNKSYDKCFSITSLEKNTSKQPYKTFLGLLRLVLTGGLVYLFMFFYLNSDSPVHWFLFLMCFFIAIYIWYLLAFVADQNAN